MQNIRERDCGTFRKFSGVCENSAGDAEMYGLIERFLASRRVVSIILGYHDLRVSYRRHPSKIAATVAAEDDSHRTLTSGFLISSRLSLHRVSPRVPFALKRARSVWRADGRVEDREFNTENVATALCRLTHSCNFLPKSRTRPPYPHEGPQATKSHLIVRRRGTDELPQALCQRNIG
jgi:hypothetical protein